MGYNYIGGGKCEMGSDKIYHLKELFLCFGKLLDWTNSTQIIIVQREELLSNTTIDFPNWACFDS